MPVANFALQVAALAWNMAARDPPKIGSKRLNGSMTYWPVSPALRGLIDDIYVFRSPGPAYRGIAGALLPQAEWTLMGQIGWEGRRGVLQPMSHAGALGPSASALRLETRGDTVVIGFGFYPEGWFAFMPIPAGTVTERVLDLETLWGPDVRCLAVCDPAQSDADLAAAVDAYMLARLKIARPVDPRIPIISAWAAGRAHDLHDLMDQLGVSQRQAQRLTTAAHGLAPRHLANKHKILRMAAVLALGMQDNRRDTWTQEYADQSHFIQNFKRYIGTTPTRFLSEPELLVRDVMQARLAIASSHPLGLAPLRKRPALRSCSTADATIKAEQASIWFDAIRRQV